MKSFFMLLFRTKSCKFLSLIEIWGWFSHFSMRNFWWIVSICSKKGLTIGIFNISTFSMVSNLFSLHLMYNFPKTHDFCHKHILKHCSTVVKYFKTTINTEFSIVNRYWSNCKTKNWTQKQEVIMWHG